MLNRRLLALSCIVFAANSALATDLFPPVAEIEVNRPRLLVRPGATELAVPLAQLRSSAEDRDARPILDQLRGLDHAAAQAMVWLATGDRSAAEKAIARLRGYRHPESFDTFHIYLRLTEFALAYDWLCGYEGFTGDIRAEIRSRVRPLADAGLKQTDDHIFHNYIWMSAGGTALWALATAGEDDASDQLYARIADRMNGGLFPAMEYLDGLPCEPMGYWALYDFTPAVLTVLGIQSAFEYDAVDAIRRDHGNWLERHFENLIHSTLPDMRYIPWGDLQSGPNGGATMSMAGTIVAMTWALDSPQGAYFSRWLADKRGPRRFYGDTALFSLLYSRRLPADPAVPQLSYLAGDEKGGHFIARSGWDDGATIVTLRSTDHFGDHNHYDQGSLVIYRNGLLAVDPPVYQRVRGPQQATEHHNTLLIGGQAQRPVRGQWFRTLEQFQQNLAAGRRLETGDMPFYRESGEWAAASAEFAAAYDAELVARCVRHVLLVRPDRVVVVDQLAAPAGKQVPEVQWLLQFPAKPAVEGSQSWAANGKSWIRCRPILPGAAVPEISATPVATHRAAYRYAPGDSSCLVHLLEVGDGDRPVEAAPVEARQTPRGIEVLLDGAKYVFAAEAPYAVTRAEAAGEQ